MKTFIYILISTVIISFVAGCKTKTLHVPVESVKTEYRNVLQRDSVRLYDSIYVREKGDTLLIERYRYLYRDRLVRDSVMIRDSIQVPYPVYIPGETKEAYPKWLVILAVIGGMAVGYGVYKGYRKIKP